MTGSDKPKHKTLPPQMTGVVVFGSINADLIFAVETLPTPGQTLMASAMTVGPGGTGANQAVAAARDRAPAVIRTLGGAGVEWAGRDDRGRLAAAPVRAVDTTAAGDCFVGVLAAGLHRGETLSAAIRRANVAAAITCTRRGSQNSLPNADEIDATLQQGTFE